MKPKVNLDALKALRDETGAPIGDCRTALEEASGDSAKAKEILRRKGALAASKRQDRVTGQGRIESYIHHDGRMGAIVEVNCETDFVARTPDFVQFCRDVAMHVAAMSPQFVRPEDAPKDSGLSAEDVKASALLEQFFVRDQKTTIGDLLKALIGKTGENVVVRRFTRFAVGGPVSG
ncbi:MAG: elongation factor Ts [Candidatus Omnitrophica bacterium CG11_big_fil_rev_8_21_14_0_20_63_9]|nr:MAG: elongation factor Ts [Candidatus Omnitrophica bacterium CG11_big_fil_rev_8_21_14_0_20_63_9]